MSSFELFQESPGLYLLILAISLVITIFVYGAFPFIYAKKCKTPIERKQYKKRCYCINAIGIVLFFVLNGAASAFPYFLWTSVLSNYGLKILEERELLLDPTITKDVSCEQDNKIHFCRKCGTNIEEGSRFCRKCGTKIMEDHNNDLQ